MKIYVAMGETAIRDSFFTPKALEKVRGLGEVKFYNRPQLSCSKEELKIGRASCRERVY